MTTTNDQYVPSDEDMRWHYAVKRMDDGATRTHAEREYTRWLAAHDARVRRDAAREALDGLADEVTHVNWDLDGPAFALRVRRFKNRNYPEETP